MRALRAVGWAVLALLALAGVSVSALAVLASSSWGRPVVARAAVRFVDEALAGHFELAGITVLPNGGVDVRGLRVMDPDGHLVLAVDHARVFADVTRLHRGRLGVSVDLDGPAVMVEEEEEGGVSIARAFAPAHAGPPEPGPAGAGDGGSRLSIELTHLGIRGGSVWWVGADGATRLEARDLEVDARGSTGGRNAEVALALRGALDLPFAAPLSIDVVLSRAGDALRLPVLRAVVGATQLSLAGEGDVAARTGRLAVTRLGIARDEARALLPKVGGGADVAGTLYAQSDGIVASAALHVVPATESGDAGGRADAAAAVRVDGAAALGFDLDVQRLDPSGLHEALPAGRVTLSGRGGLAGRSLDDLRGEVALSIAPSTLRGGAFGPVEVSARADRGAFDVQRLSGRAPGLTLEGAGRFRPGGTAAGRVTAEAADLGRAARNLGLLLGEKLPALAGRARVDATFSGTAAAPAVQAHLDAPALGIGALALRGVRLDAGVSGPFRAPAARVEGAIESARTSGGELARGATIRANLTGEDVAAAVSASVPRLGREPLAVEARGRFGPRRETIVLSELFVAYPGTRYALEAPATLRFAGPSVDRLALAAGRERLVVEGGLAKRGALDARLEITALDLTRLPRGLLPPGADVAGVVSAFARATGTTARPRLDGRLALASGAFRTLRGLEADATFGWDGAARRASVALSARRAEGGAIDVSVDLPVPLAGRPGAPVAARIRAGGLPVASILVAAGVDAPVDGAAGIEGSLEGTAGAPTLRAELRVDDGAYDDLTPLAIALSVEDTGDRVRVHGGASYGGRPALALDGSAPLDLSDLLATPGAALRALSRAPVELDATVPDVDLARYAGALGLPRDLAGVLRATAHVTGTARAPRGNVIVAVQGGAASGYRDLGVRVELAADDARTALGATVALGGAELLRVDAGLDDAPDRFLGPDRQARLRATPLRVDAVVPRGDLARAAVAGLPLSGVVEARLTVRGTAAAPEADLALHGSAVAVEGRPLGDLDATARYARGRTDASAEVRPRAGGAVTVRATLDAPLGLEVSGRALRDAPLVAHAVARAVDLGVVPALLPGTVRTAGGTLTADVTAEGPVGQPRVRGTVSVKDGRLAVTEYGEWTAITVDAEVNDDAIEVRTVTARRGAGRLQASGFARGLATPAARVEAHARLDGFSIARAGQELANLDLRADATGTWAASKLDVLVKVPSATVRLPPRTPRSLQSLDGRSDIVIGKKPERKRASSPRPGRPAAKPFELVAHVVAPGPLMVKSDNPRVNIDLKADVTYELSGSDDYMTGSVEVVRGTVEPIGGRVFQVQRGKVQFTGGPPKAAMLDVEAKYENPAATVTVVVAGPAVAPEIRLTSQPPMDEGQIALLIATGRTDLKSGTGGVDTVSGEEAGKAALGAVATQAFKNLLADKLPVDTVALDASALRAGKYVTDKVYVGYVHRFDARPERGENENEVRVEYQITPRWTLESRYGTAASSASLLWSRDY